MICHLNQPAQALDINVIELTGHVVNTPEMKLSAKGYQTASFCLAVRNEWVDLEGKKYDSADFFRIIAHGELAKSAFIMLTKGTELQIQGQLVNRNYEGKNQIMYYVTEIHAKNITLTELK